VSENNQIDFVIINCIQQVIGELPEIGSTQPTWVKVVASGIPLDRGQNQIQITPKGRNNPLGNIRVVHGSVADVIGELRVTTDRHRLFASAGGPEFVLWQPFDPAGLEILKALQSLLVADVMRAGVKILKERGNQLHSAWRIEFGSLVEQLSNFWHAKK
jgi:hypothetical protein